jgi:hypothetical protein
MLVQWPTLITALTWPLGALFLLLYFVVFVAFNLVFPGYVAAV